MGAAAIKCSAPELPKYINDLIWLGINVYTEMFDSISFDMLAPRNTLH